MPQILFRTIFQKNSFSFRDGSIGYSKYKPWSLEDASDSDIFITIVVPFQLHSTKTSGDKIIHWQNPRPSSVR
jgi:hypothetical protein